jgi:hypothetical protein
MAAVILKRFLIVVGCLGLLCMVPGLMAFRALDHQQPLPNFDKRQPGGKVRKAPAKQAAVEAAALEAQLPGVRVDWDPILGSPRWIRLDPAKLGPTRVKQATQSLTGVVPGIPIDPVTVVKGFITQHAGLFGQGEEILANAKLARNHRSPGGLQVLVWEQRVAEIEVFEGRLVANLGPRNELVAVSSRLVPQGLVAAGKGKARRAALTQPLVSANQALTVALPMVGETPVAGLTYQPAQLPVGTEQLQWLKGQGVRDAARVRLVWLPLNREVLQLCWEVIVTGQTRGEMYGVLVDAEQGDVLARQSYTKYISEATYRVYTGDSPTPSSPGLSAPATNQPPEVPRVLLTLTALDTNASPAGWLNDGVNETLGNNVDAHLDRDGNNVADLPRPMGTTNRVFDFPLDLTRDPGTYSAASVVQLFYWNNWAHDQLYELGFTETAGNFQQDNFGRGGTGNDPVQADGQDGDGYNNANMATPPDGMAPRMQMFLFSGSSPFRDGSLDGEVVIHEYVHGLTDRLVGGGSALNQWQSLGMAEGWSDFYALSLLAQEADPLDGNYAMGAYVSRGFNGLKENYYFGIRRYPYCTDRRVNPLTFKDIDPVQAGTYTDIPRSSALGLASASEVHNQGEVWCMMLWEVRARLIARHGFAMGNRLALLLVTEALSLTPSNPSFVDGRDAIILADQWLHDGANHFEIWSAFAKRGLGFFAESPDSSTTTGVHEDFNLPDDLQISPTAETRASGPLGGPFVPRQVEFTLVNAGTGPLSWSAGTGSLLEISSSGGILQPGQPEVVRVKLASAVALFPVGIYTNALFITNLTTGIVHTRLFSLRIGQVDYLVENFEDDDSDLDFQSLTFTPDGTASHYSVCRQPVTGFFTDPTGGTRAVLGDDTYTYVPLTGPGTVSLFGQSASGIWIGANGEVTFTEGNPNYFQTDLNVFYERLRVAALYADLNPLTGGEVSWRQLPDRIAVTWQRVPEYGKNNQNTFQIELFQDGRVRLTWLNVEARLGQVGFSRGEGIPLGLIESDFSAYPVCGSQLRVQAPTELTEGAGVLAGAGQIALTAPLPTNLVVQLVSDDPTELTVPASVVIPAGATNAFFDLEGQDDALLDGSQWVRIIAEAPGFAAGNTLLVIHDNETAVLSVTLPDPISESDHRVGGVIHVSQAPQRQVAISLALDNPDEVSLEAPEFVILAPGQQSVAFELVVRNDRFLDGPQPFTVTASVENWTAGQATGWVQDDEGTNLVLQLPAIISEAAGTMPGAGKVAISGPMHVPFTVSLMSQHPEILQVPPQVLIPAGATSAVFDLVAVDDAWAMGDTQVVVWATAPALGSGTGLVIVADNEIPVVPFLPTPAHGATNQPRQLTLSWMAGRGNAIINGDFEFGELTGWQQENQGLGGWVINSGAFDPSSPDGPLPPLGSHGVMLRQVAMGVYSLWQEVTVSPIAARAQLTWHQRIRNHAERFGTNQQLRVELRTPENRLLEVLYASPATDPLLGDWVEISRDLSRYRGQSVRLVFVGEDRLGYLNVHLDDIRLDLGPGNGSVFEVYLGSQTNLGPPDLLGTTPNMFWEPGELQLNHEYYWQIIACRGGQRVVGPIWRFSTALTQTGQTLIGTGSQWKYLDNGVNQGSAWRSNSFNDATWVVGPARFGYGGDGEVTVVQYGGSPSNKFMTTYFRRFFDVVSTNNLVKLQARLLRDDGAVLFLNGAEVARNNMPAQPAVINFQTAALLDIEGSNEQTLVTIPLRPDSLVLGPNLLAVEVHQYRTNSPDLAFDLELIATYAGGTNQPPQVALTNPVRFATLATPGTILLEASPADSDGRVVRVEFYQDGLKAGESLAAPFALPVYNLAMGEHTFSAIAFDDQGAAGFSTVVPVLVTVTNGLPITIVPSGSRWRYLDNGSDQGTGWRALGYNDNQWREGPAQLGYEDGDEATTVGYGPNYQDKYITTYFRHVFTNEAEFTSVSLRLLRDDGAVVYLNGYEIFRSNLPGFPTIIGYRTLASTAVNGDSENTWHTANIYSGFVFPGRNILAVEVHQAATNSPDLSFDFELSGIGNFLPQVQITTPTNNTVQPGPRDVMIQAEANDRYGAVRLVEFFRNGEKLGETTTPPYEFVWRNAPLGLHALTASATDDVGTTNQSSIIVIRQDPLSLQSGRLPDGGLRLVWPPEPSGAFLEQTRSLTFPDWQTFTGAIQHLDGMPTVIIPPTGTNQFFRLRTP